MALYLRSVNAEHKSYGGFQWPSDIGAVVTAPDWSPEPVCGNGLHGLLWGQGDINFLGKPIFQVVEYNGDEAVDLDGKFKFPHCTLKFVGTASEAAHYMQQFAPAGVVLPFITATAGYRGTATAGYRGTATAGVEGTAVAGDEGTATAGNLGTATAGNRGTATAGYRGTATAGDEGTATADYGGTVAAGNWGTATAGDDGTATADYRGIAIAGHRGTATAGYRGTATAGYRGTATAGDEGTATAGYEGTVSAGDRGILQLTYYKNSRKRIVTAYVGENGIKPNTKYKLDGNYNFAG